MNAFDRQLEIGRVAEGLIARWLQARGTAVLPAYEIEKSHGKGPQLFSAEGDFVAPDMLAFTHNGICWIEAKHKSVFTWHRISHRWTTGIDLRHYGDYFRVLWRTKQPVWLLFYHRDALPDAKDLRYDDCPRQCPTGLFGAQLLDLVILENHRAPRLDEARIGMKGHGRSGMVYWAHDALRLLATKEEVLSASRPAKSIHQGGAIGSMK
jgi:hypothetical protein